MARARRPGARPWGVGVGLAVLAIAGGALAWRLRGGDPLREGRSAYERGDWTAASEAARGRLAALPEDREALRLLARSAARMGRDDSAQAIYRRLGAANMQAEDYDLLARGLLRQGRHDLAHSALLAAIRIEPDRPETLDALADDHARADRPEEARAVADRLAKVPGWEARGDLRLGRLLLEAREPAAAAAAFDRALRRDPGLRGGAIDPASARKLMARALLEGGRPAEAQGPLRRVLDAGPDPEASWLLSRALLQSGDVAGASEARDAAGAFGRDDLRSAEPSPYVGSSRCAGCHRDQYRTEQAGRHSQTLRRPEDLREMPLPERAIVDPIHPGVRHELRRVEGGIRVETRVEGKAFRALVEYVLGSGRQGRTMLARDEQGQARELRLSHYHDEPAWDRTFQHPARPPDPIGFLGRPLLPDSFHKCLHCHSTHYRAALRSDAPESADRGIGCERCHGPGGHHLRAVATGFPDLAIARPRLLPAADSVALCAQCHRAPAGSPATSDPSSVRFQAPSLVRSRCYTEGDGGLSCVTCHDPHRDAETSPAHYEARCLACHAPPERNGPPASTLCPVSPARGCLGCHMPRVADAVPHAVFTDHHIRVHREPTTPRPSDLAK